MLCSSDLSIEYYPKFLASSEAEDSFRLLLNDIDWYQEIYQFYGKKFKSPRLVAWYGDKNASSRYSGLIHHPNPWNDCLYQLKKKVEKMVQTTFNSILLNLYRDGMDSMGWHSDNEKELGSNPVIASLSLGVNRKFCLRENASKKIITINLMSGSLLIMTGQTQSQFKHSLPKIKNIDKPRINLIFRQIHM